MQKLTGHILIAEDEVPLRSLMTHLLQSEGYRVTRVGSGQEAWQELTSQIFDLLITEADLPILSGLDLISRASPKLPVLMVSANRSRIREAAERQQNGPTHFACLLKPFRPKELLRQVARLIDREGSQAVAVGGS
ncbi:response regulator [bacterium]|nr:response regulator [bacterium]